MPLYAPRHFLTSHVWLSYALLPPGGHDPGRWPAAAAPAHPQGQAISGGAGGGHQVSGVPYGHPEAMTKVPASTYNM
jgi:hypothetical protein